MEAAVNLVGSGGGSKLRGYTATGVEAEVRSMMVKWLEQVGNSGGDY
jgi:hypothetical protein